MREKLLTLIMTGALAFIGFVLLSHLALLVQYYSR